MFKKMFELELEMISFWEKVTFLDFKETNCSDSITKDENSPLLGNEKFIKFSYCHKKA